MFIEIHSDDFIRANTKNKTFFDNLPVVTNSAFSINLTRVSNLFICLIFFCK